MMCIKARRIYAVLAYITYVAYDDISKMQTVHQNGNDTLNAVLVRLLFTRAFWPLSSDRQHLSCDVCLEVRGLSELFCVVMCTEALHSHKHT